MPFELHRVRGTVAELHDRSSALVSRPLSGRLAVAHQPVDRAVVLGSGQAEEGVDRDACAAAGTTVVRRRSGGGAVLVEPGGLVWVDLVVPTGDPLWCADVGRAAWWVGEAWARALGQVGLAGLEVWKGPMLRREWSSLVCFAGRAGGEVTGPGGGKLVGISQRRTRHGSLFQCACLLRWEPPEILSLLRLSAAQRAHALTDLAGAGATAGGAGAGEEREDEILAHLVRTLP
jgi:lipoate-protein ligase A